MYMYSCNHIPGYLTADAIDSMLTLPVALESVPCGQAPCLPEKTGPAVENVKLAQI